MKPLRVSPSMLSMICSSSAVPRVVTDQRLGLAPGEQGRAVGARQQVDLAGDGRGCPRGRGRRCARLRSTIDSRSICCSMSSNRAVQRLRLVLGEPVGEVRPGLLAHGLDGGSARSILPFTKQACSSFAMARPYVGLAGDAAPASRAAAASWACPAFSRSSSWMRHSSGSCCGPGSMASITTALGHLPGAALDHRDAFRGAGHDDVELAASSPGRRWG